MKAHRIGANGHVRRLLLVVAVSFVMMPTSAVGNRRMVRQLVSRDGETRTILTDGRELLVGAEIVINDPMSGRSLRRPLHVARSGHTATALPDGKVIVLGGRDRVGRIVPEVELIDPNTGTSDVIDIAAWHGLIGHTATLIDDHRVLIGGGVDAEGATGSLLSLDIDTREITRMGALPSPRAYASARLLPDGHVVMWGGRNADQSLETSGVIVDPSIGSVIEIFQPVAETSTQYLVGSEPSDGASDVPSDVRLTFRFSRPVRANASTGALAVVTAASGEVQNTIVTAEAGRLLFITPTVALQPATSYTVTLDGVRDAATDGRLPPIYLSFATSAGGTDAADDEQWNPFERGQFQQWQTNRPPSVWQKLPPLQAAPGVTALAGQVLRLNGAPLAKVTLVISGHKSTTDASGRFLLELNDEAEGWQELWIDGRTANRPRTTYGTFEAAVRLKSSKTTILPFTIWMPKLDTAHQVTISSPTEQEMIITTPWIPGLELHLPAHTVIKDHDGQPVRQISITPIPLDRTPFPLPTDVDVPIYFTIQPGGAYVQVYGTPQGDYAPGARLIYPNYRGRPAGTRMNFWHYDPEDGKGWYVYGMGSVNTNGRQVVPDPGVTIREFSGAMVAPPGLAPLIRRLLGLSPSDGDPVDLGTGLFIMNKVDLALTDVLPLELRRTYRQNDTVSRSFGIGSTHMYDMFLVGTQNPWTYIDLVLSDGARVHYDRISSGTSFIDAVYEDTSSPTGFFKSRIAWNGAGWNLNLKDGTLIQFLDGFVAQRPAQAAATRIQDRYGNAIVLTRNADADLTRITSPSGRWIDLTYDAAHRVTQARDNINRLVQYTYDGSGRLWKVTDVAGGLTQYTYDTSHRMLTITDPRGIVYLTNVYDTAGRVITQTQADSTTYHFAYTADGSGHITQTDVTNPRGYVRRVTFDSIGYPSTDTLAVGQPVAQTATYELQPATNLVLAITDPLSRRTGFTYDTSGNLTSTTRLAGSADAVTTAFTYEPTFQQLASVRDALNHTATLTYDARGNLTAVSDPLSHQTTYTYNFAGQRQSATTAAGRTSFSYDLGDLVSVTDPLGRTTTLFCDAAGRVVATTDPLGHTTRRDYDAMNRVTRITDALGQVTSFGYDANSNLLTVTDARNKTTTWTYDTMDRPSTRTDPLNRQETFAYDANGNQTTWTDRKGHVTAYSYDSLDRQTAIGFGATGAPPEYESLITTTLDAGNRPIQIVDSLAGTISRTYDLLDRLTAETTPEGTVGYTYDAAGRRVTMTVTGGQASGGGISRVQYKNATGGEYVSSLPVTFNSNVTAGDLIVVLVSSYYGDTYVPSPSVSDTLGNTYHLAAAINDSTAESIASESQFIYYAENVTGGADTVTFSAGSTAYFVMTAIEYSGVATSNSLDQASRYRHYGNGYDTFTDYTSHSVTTTTADELLIGNVGTLVASDIYAPDSGWTELTVAANSFHSQAVDERIVSSAGSYTLSGVLSSGQTRVSASVAAFKAAGGGGTSGSSVSYSYDDANRLVGLTQGTAAVVMTADDADRRTSLALPNGIVVEYTYDNASQLTAITYRKDSATLGTLTYTYDAAGRRTSVGGSYARTGLPAALAGATYNDANQTATWQGVPFTYDANGNLTSDGARTFGWDTRNQLTSVGGTTSATFSYDGFGRRRGKTAAGTATSFLFDGQNLVQEQSPAGAQTASLLVGLAIDETFARTDANGTSTLLSDALGSTLGLANGSGTIQTEYTFEPFGRTTATGTVSANTQQYAGRENDGGDLYYNRARFYSPVLGRFISEDPLGFDGGDINLYSYTGNQPTRFTDPSGLKPRATFDPTIGPGGPRIGPRRSHMGPGGPHMGPSEGPLRPLPCSGEPGGGPIAVSGQVIIPILNPIFGLAVGYTRIPATGETFWSLGPGASIGRSGSFGPLFGPNPSGVLPGLSFAGGYNWPDFYGVEHVMNPAGHLSGASYGTPGASASITYGWCSF